MVAAAGVGEARDDGVAEPGVVRDESCRHLRSTEPRPTGLRWVTSGDNLRPAICLCVSSMLGLGEPRPGGVLDLLPESYPEDAGEFAAESTFFGVSILDWTGLKKTR